MIIPGSTLYVTSLWLIKSSMVIFYKRLADRTRYQIVYNITLAFLAATWLVLFFDIIFKCYPPQRQWQGIINAQCEDASISTAMDAGIDALLVTCPQGPSTVNYWLTTLCMSVSLDLLGLSTNFFSQHLQ
jgi:hypothetical protein